MKIVLVCILFSLVLFILSGTLFGNGQAKSKSVTVSANLFTQVVIDAGHGGRDGGAVSSEGYLEKDINLLQALCLRDFLCFAGTKNVMTREDDRLLCDENDPSLKGKLKMTDLKNRVGVAEENAGSIFVSIHMNKFPIEKYKGLQVYFSKNNEQSRSLASAIQENVKATLQPDNNRKCKGATSSIFVLDRITVPAVLVECGFLSNREDTNLLMSDLYRAKLSLVIGESILQTIANN